MSNTFHICTLIWNLNPNKLATQLNHFQFCHYIGVCACTCNHDDVIKWKHFPRYWLFVQGIHRSQVNSPHKGQWRGALMFSFICAWINDWVNNREAGNLRRHRAHCEVIVMPEYQCILCKYCLNHIKTETMYISPIFLVIFTFFMLCVFQLDIFHSPVG